MSLVTEENEFLQLIPGGGGIIISPTDGTEILARADDVFLYIDSDFTNCKTDELGSATPETPARVYEMTKDATFAQMFRDPEKLRFEQAQIKAFARDYDQWLRGYGRSNFFLFKSYNNFFVTQVFIDNYGNLHAFMSPFKCSIVWRAAGRSRVILPQLTT